MSGIERSDRCDLGSTRYGRIARSRRAGVCRVGVIRQLRGNVERESGSIGEDGIKAPALGKPLRRFCPRAIERQVPSAADADAMTDITVAGSVEQMRAVGGLSRIALLETRSIVEVMPVGVGKRVIDRPEL